MQNDFKIVENGLIPIYQKDGQHLSDARLLHEFLGIKKAFSDWMKYQIEGLELIKDKDFITIMGESSGGRPSLEYALTVETCKHISMASKGENGKKARQYFINCERKLKEIIQTPQLDVKELLKLAYNELDKKDIVIQNKQAQIEEMKSAVDFIENIFKPSTVCRKIGEFAKTASLTFSDGKIIGPNQMFELLRQMGILMWGNLPKTEYIKAGYFELKENIDKNNIAFAPTTLITTKGQEWLYKKLKKYLETGEAV